MNEIKNDPPVDEVRETRHQISARFNHDPAQLVAYYLELQQQYQGRLMDSSKSKEVEPHAV